MVDPEFYDQNYIVQCPICHKRFQTFSPLSDLQRLVEEIKLEQEHPIHVRWAVFPDN